MLYVFDDYPLTTILYRYKLLFLAIWLFKFILSHSSFGDRNSQYGPCQGYQGLSSWRHEGCDGHSQEGNSGQGEEQRQEGVGGVSREYQRIDHSEGEEGECLRQSNGSQSYRSILPGKQTQCLRMNQNFNF